VKTEQRRQQILNLLEETGALNVSELADRFSVSVVTIRKDLDDLESEDLLQRTFGGAVFSHRSRFNRSFLERAQQHRREKCAIAAAAHSYIKDGDTIMLDAGTTTLALAERLKTQVKSAFIITCSVPAALELSSAEIDRVIRQYEIDFEPGIQHLQLRPELPLPHIGIRLLAHAAVFMIALGNKSLRSRIPDASGYACNEDVFHW
jgi:DeoR/GlpR family transcriptional regulator of sugar metabolism